MKLFIILCMISFSALSARQETLPSGPAPKLVVQKVRNIDYDKNEAIISFWSTNQVYRLPKNSAVLPCLWNGWKSTQEVILKTDEGKSAIIDCKLYSGGIKQMGTYQGTPKAQAQEEKQK